MDGKQPRAQANSNIMTQETWSQMSPQQQQQYMAQWQYYQQLQREREALARQQAGQTSDPQAQARYQQWLQQQGQQAQAPQQQTDAYHEWLQQQIVTQQQLQGQQLAQQYQQTNQPAPQVQSDPNAYRQHLEQIEQQAGQDQPAFSQPWLSPEQQAAKQAEMQDQTDYQPQQLAQYPTEQQLPQSNQEQIPQAQPVSQVEQPQPPVPQVEQAPPVVEIGPHATVDHSHDSEATPQSTWKVTQTIGNGSEYPEQAPPPKKKSHKKLTVLMSTLIFAAVGTAVVVVFSMISQVGAKTLSCISSGQNNTVADLVSYELKFSVRLAGESFSDITTNAQLMFNNNIDAQNYVNSGQDGRVSKSMIPDDADYIKSTSGAVIEENKVNYSTVYKSSYVGLLGGVDMDTYRGTSAQLLSDVQNNLESTGYTCSYK